MPTYTYRADGESNFYTILCNTNWFAKVQLNGELTTLQQEDVMDNIVDILNWNEK